MDSKEDCYMIEERIRGIIAETLNIESKDISPNLSLIRELGIDKYALEEIIVNIEEEFGIKIPEKEVEEIVNVNDLDQRVRRQIAEKEVRS
jgi:acyl carrier protein